MQPVICTICEREIAPEDIIEFDEQTLCPHCASANTIICTCCGERILGILSAILKGVMMAISLFTSWK